jgi:hypothetical protein
VVLVVASVVEVAVGSVLPVVGSRVASAALLWTVTSAGRSTTLGARLAATTNVAANPPMRTERMSRFTPLNPPGNPAALSRPTSLSG